MKKRKLTLTLAVGLISIAGLASCNEVTAKEGVLLTYTDANGTRIDYTAKELLDDYDNTASAASTNFDKFKEVLIRKYYKADAMKSKLAELTRKANNAVDSLKKQAQDAAGGDASQYLKEMEKIYNSNHVKNIDELYDLKLYEEEEKDFTSTYKSKTNNEAMRDGVDKNGKKFFAASDLFDPDDFKGYDGYLKDRLPYHVSHILVKTESAQTGNFTEDKVSSSEATKLSDVVKGLAGATGDKGAVASAERTSFEELAHTYSDDTGSKANYGELTDKDNTPMDISTDYVPEFKLGLYAYETLFNKLNKAENNAYATDERKAPLLPSDDAEYSDEEGEKKTIDYVKNMEIGQIPYGVFAALGDTDLIDGQEQKVADDPKFTYELKNNNAAYYARNVLFNKYLNKHEIAVIVPNRIPYNDYLDSKRNENVNSNFSPDVEVKNDGQMDTAGVYDSIYAALPGFSTFDTHNSLPGIDSNVLTTEKGQIILVARVDSDGYHGIHFIVINRSALELYGHTIDADGKTVVYSEDDYSETKSTADITTLSEYYAFTEPTEKEFKDNLRYISGGEIYDKTTYVNAILHEDHATYTSKYTKLEDYIGKYNPNLDTYMFQALLGNEIKFNDTTDNSSVKKAKDLIISWVKAARAKSVKDSTKKIDDAWTSYVEMLNQQEVARKVTGNDSKLISETCAIGLATDANKKGTADSEYDIGGLCYHVN